jgi:hypothetical protein
MSKGRRNRPRLKLDGFPRRRNRPGSCACAWPRFFVHGLGSKEQGPFWVEAGRVSKEKEEGTARGESRAVFYGKEQGKRHETCSYTKNLGHDAKNRGERVLDTLLVSLAFIESDRRRCLDKAIAFIPADSEYCVYIFFKERKKYEEIVNGFADLSVPDAAGNVQKQRQRFRGR